MDIRNIEVPELKLDPTMYLSKIYELGQAQLEGYIKIENLPEPPLDINPPKSQVILKDFIGRVVEELTEGYESTTEVFNLMEAHGWNIDNLTDAEYNSIINSLQNANEEQADAIGFYITLLIYSNIYPEDIYKYVSINLEKEVHTLDMLMSFGVRLLFESGVMSDINEIGYWLFNSDITKNFGMDFHKVGKCIAGFYCMSLSTHELEKLILWEITYQINVARNLLKNRPWKQTQVMSKELDYQEAVVKSFLMYLGFLAIQGFTSSSLLELFHRKQQLNLWRQNSGY